MSEDNAPVLSGEKSHSRFGCSQHPYIAVCPAVQNSGESGAAAAKGNDLHDIAAEVLMAALDGDTVMIDYAPGERLPCGQIVSQEDLDKVDDYVNHVLGLKNQYPQCTEIFIEVPQKMSSLGLPDDETTPDAVLIEPFGLCIVADLKTGQVAVSPYSEQLRSYGLERFIEYGCSAMLCCVSQNGTLKKQNFSERQIEMYQAYMTDQIEMAQWPNPPRVPGKACKYCSDKDCPARQGAMQIGTGSLLTVKPEELDPEQVARFLEFYEIINEASKQMDRIKSRGHALVESGVSVKGWELRPGDPMRGWAKESAAKEEILKLFAVNKDRVPNPEFEKTGKGRKTMDVDAPIDPEQIMVPPKPPAMRSPSQIEGLLGKSKAVTTVLKPLIKKYPSPNKHLKRVVPKLEE